MKDLPQFKVGDRVTWTSHSQGSHVNKTGVVQEVIKTGARPCPEKWPSLYTGAGAGGGRNHESYVVTVTKPGKKPLVYWPRTSALKLVR